MVMAEHHPEHCALAMRLLTSGAALRPKEGQFLGGLAFDRNPLSDKQANWLEILAARYLPSTSETSK